MELPILSRGGVSISTDEKIGPAKTAAVMSPAACKRFQTRQTVRRKLYIVALVLMALVVLLSGCADDGDPDPPMNPGGPGTGPVPVDVCVCPGLPGRFGFTACPVEPINGDIVVEFADCRVQDAIFIHQPTGQPVCRVEIQSSSTGTLNVTPNPVDVPIGPISHIFLQTTATLVGVNEAIVTLTCNDLSKPAGHAEKLFHLLTVKVSNNCP
jgi:hypothetical protein